MRKRLQLWYYIDNGTRVALLGGKSLLDWLGCDVIDGSTGSPRYSRFWLFKDKIIFGLNLPYLGMKCWFWYSRLDIYQERKPAKSEGNLYYHYWYFTYGTSCGCTFWKMTLRIIGQGGGKSPLAPLWTLMVVYMYLESKELFEK